MSAQPEAQLIKGEEEETGQLGAGLLILPGVGYNMAFGAIQEDASSPSEGKFSSK